MQKAQGISSSTKSLPRHSHVFAFRSLLDANEQSRVTLAFASDYICTLYQEEIIDPLQKAHHASNAMDELCNLLKDAVRDEESNPCGLILIVPATDIDNVIHHLLAIVGKSHKYAMRTIGVAARSGNIYVLPDLRGPSPGVREDEQGGSSAVQEQHLQLLLGFVQDTGLVPVIQIATATRTIDVLLLVPEHKHDFLVSDQDFDHTSRLMLRRITFGPDAVGLTNLLKAWEVEHRHAQAGASEAVVMKDSRARIFLIDFVDRDTKQYGVNEKADLQEIQEVAVPHLNKSADHTEQDLNKTSYVDPAAARFGIETRPCGSAAETGRIEVKKTAANPDPYQLQQSNLKRVQRRQSGIFQCHPTVELRAAGSRRSSTSSVGSVSDSRIPQAVPGPRSRSSLAAVPPVQTSIPRPTRPVSRTSTSGMPGMEPGVGSGKGHGNQGRRSSIHLAQAGHVVHASRGRGVQDDYQHTLLTLCDPDAGYRWSKGDAERLWLAMCTASSA